MARAAGHRQSKRGKRRADARSQRVARSRPKRAHSASARARATAKKRAAKKRTVRATVRRQVAKLKRAVAKRVVRAKLKAAKKRVQRGVKSLRKRVTRARAGAQRGARALGRRATAASKRVQRGVKAIRKRAVAAGRNVSRGAKRVGAAVQRAVVVSSAKRALRRGPVASAMPAPEAFAKQRASATPREQLMFELQRARASVKAATQGLSSGTAEQPIAPGKWSIKEIVLHLSERDRVRLEEFARTLGGQPRSWASIPDPEMAAVNEAHLAPLRAHNWDDALRRLDTMREQLLLRLSQVPGEPDDVWQKGHPFGDMMWNLPEHDRHHAQQIKLARMGATVPAED